MFLGGTFLKCCVFLVISVTINGVSAAICDAASIFVKRNGFKPSGVLTSLLYNSTTPGAGITLQCFNSCNNIGNCSSFYVDYDASTCYAFNSSLDQNLIIESSPPSTGNVNYFQRVCLTAVPRACLVNLWSLDVDPGYRLVGYDRTSIANVSLYDCAAACFNESTYTCRSAAFWATTPAGLGECRLSGEDRRTQADSYRAMPAEVIYLENQCARPQSGSCSMNQFQNSTLTSFTDITITNTTIDQCEQRCQAERRFVCRGFTYTPGATTSTTSSCLIYSDDSFDLGPDAIIEAAGSVYRERVACLDLFVRCNATLLNVTLLTREPFSGRIYARDVTSPSCSTDGASTTSTSLLLAIVSLPGSPSCGTVTTTLDNSTGVTAITRLASAVIVVQHNSVIQTIGDRTIRVSCNVDSQGPQDTMLNKSLIVNVGNGNSGVSNVTVNGSLAGLPTLRFHIVDLDNGTRDTNQTTLGRNLQLKIDVQPTNIPYGILVYNLLVSNEAQTSSQLLLNSLGCPTSPNIFPGLYRDPDGNYAANFTAFRITNSALVRFNLTVHFCEVACQEVVCGQDVINRLRREDVDQTVSSTNQSVRTGNKVDQSLRTGVLIGQSRIVLPEDENIQFDLIVGEKGRRSVIENISARILTSEPLPESNIKENDTKIAGAAYDEDYVCLQYSTFLALLFGWAAVQVVLFVAAFCLVRWQLTRQDNELRRKLEDDLNAFDESRRGHWSQNVEAVATT